MMRVMLLTNHIKVLWEKKLWGAGPRGPNGYKFLKKIWFAKN